MGAYAITCASFLRQWGIDKDVLQNINDLQQLNEADKNHILKTLGALIREAKTRKAYAS